MHFVLILALESQHKWKTFIESHMKMHVI